MKKLIAFLLVIVFLFAAAPARAQDVPVLPDVPDAVLAPLDQYDLAPYRGVLLSPDAIANIIADYKTFGDKLRIELERVKAEDEANKKFAIDELTASCTTDKTIANEKLADAERRNKMLLDEQDKLEKSKKNVKAWALGGVAVGLVVGMLGFYGVLSVVK